MRRIGESSRISSPLLLALWIWLLLVHFIGVHVNMILVIVFCPEFPIEDLFCNPPLVGGSVLTPHFIYQSDSLCFSFRTKEKMLAVPLVPICLFTFYPHVVRV